MKFLDILKTLGPVILALVPGGAVFAPLIIAGVEVAENSQKPGAEKRVIGKDAVSLAANAANAIAKKEVVNTLEAEQAYEDSVDAVISVVNIVKKAQGGE